MTFQSIATMPPCHYATCQPAHQPSWPTPPRLAFKISNHKISNHKISKNRPAPHKIPFLTNVSRFAKMPQNGGKIPPSQNIQSQNIKKNPAPSQNIQFFVDFFAFGKNRSKWMQNASPEPRITKYPIFLVLLTWSACTQAPLNLNRPLLYSRSAALKLNPKP